MALLLTLALATVAALVAEPADGLLFLLVVPIAMIAAEHGPLAGLVLAAIAIAMMVSLDLTRSAYELSILGYATHTILFLLTALAAGRFTGSLRGASEHADARESLASSLKRSEEIRNSEILNAVSALVAMLDAEGRITYFNPSSEKLSGYRAEEVMGKRLVDVLVPADEQAEATRTLSLLRPEQMPMTGESAWKTKTGEVKIIQWSVTALTDPAGRIERLIATGLDVTDRHEAEREVAESQERLATYFDNAPSLLFWLDLEGRFVEVNKSMERLLMKPREEIVGYPATDFFTPEIGRSILRTNREVLTLGNTIVADDAIETDEGIQHFQTVKFPLRNGGGEIYGIGGISYNITDLVEIRQAVERARRETAARLARAVEFRDEATLDHVERMSSYCELIALRLGFDPVRSETLRMAAAMHDAGKIAVPDSILLKPGPLTPKEREIMQSHAKVGWELLRGSESEILELAALIAYTHHERFDGRGYPRGLAGSQIPIEGRIAAVADVFDALTSDRVYRDALPLEEAVEIMRAERGGHFDPGVLDAFFEDMDAVREIEKQPRRLDDLSGLPRGIVSVNRAPQGPEHPRWT